MPDNDEKEIFGIDLDVKDAIGSAEKLVDSIKNIGDPKHLVGLIESLSGIAVAIGPIIVTLLALKVAFDTVLDGEKLKQMNAQFEEMSKQVGIVGDSLKHDLIDSAKGLAEETEIIKAANKALVTMGESAKQLPEIMDLARRVSNKFGGDLVERFEQINTAIATGNNRLLKHMGIVIDTDKAVKDYAKSLGVNVDALNDAGKRQAILNEVLKQGATRFKDVGNEAELAINTSKQFNVAIKEIGEMFVVAFEKLAGPSVRSVMSALASAANTTKLLLQSVLGGETEQQEAKIGLLEKRIKSTNAEIQKMEERRNSGNAFATDDQAIAAAKRSVQGYQEELDKLNGKKQEKINKDKEEMSVGAASAASENDRFINKKKQQEDELKFQEQILKMKQANNKAELDLAVNQDELAREQHERLRLMDEEYALKKKQVELDLSTGKIASQQQADMILEEMETEHQNRLLEVEKQTAYERERMLQNYLDKSTSVFDGVGRAAEVAGKRAQAELSNFGKQGAMIFDTFQKHASNAFMKFGESLINHSQSASQIMKSFFLGALADIAESQGKLYLAMAIVDPSKGVAGAALLVLAGVLRAMAGNAGGGGGGGVGGGGFDSGGMGTYKDDGRDDLKHEPRKAVTIQVMGHYFETEQTKTKLMDMVREATDATDFKYVQIGGQ